jgi:hypothetical protein
MKMKAKFILILLLLVYTSFLFSQDNTETEFTNYFQLKAGKVANGHGMSVGMDTKFYLISGFSVAPEMIILGTPTVGGTLRFDVAINNKLRVAPQVGEFVIFPSLSPIQTFGAEISYLVNPKLILFIDVRVYGFEDNLLSYGTGVFELRDLDKRKPIMISAGIGF